jgi:hypothetical protein
MRGLELVLLPSGVKHRLSEPLRLGPKTVSGREFDWGGTSIKT